MKEIEKPSLVIDEISPDGRYGSLSGNLWNVDTVLP